MSREDGHARRKRGDAEMIAITDHRFGPADQFGDDQRTWPFRQANDTGQIRVYELARSPSAGPMGSARNWKFRNRSELSLMKRTNPSKPGLAWITM